MANKKEQNTKIIYLCLLYVVLNILDVILTLAVVQNGKGTEINGFLNYYAERISFMNTMVLKIVAVAVAMYIIYSLRDKYDDINIKGKKIEGIDIITSVLILINIIYILIVINGLIVFFFPAYAPFKIS
ncbi:MAG: DUF5658 family protein [Candidatus Ratteibacteria bacterium]|nr:DUF5658 family protein [Candidatus Ratteibacteria bacterium]